jgi:hypothetical protein
MKGQLKQVDKMVLDEKVVDKIATWYNVIASFFV